jgi:hypothetical protein
MNGWSALMLKISPHFMCYMLVQPLFSYFLGELNLFFQLCSAMLMWACFIFQCGVCLYCVWCYLLLLCSISDRDRLFIQYFTYSSLYLLLNCIQWHQHNETLLLLSKKSQWNTWRKFYDFLHLLFCFCHLPSQINYVLFDLWAFIQAI